MNRVVVVDASGGLGCCRAMGLGPRGDRVALLMRRTEVLDRAAPELSDRAPARRVVHR